MWEYFFHSTQMLSIHTALTLPGLFVCHLCQIYIDLIIETWKIVLAAGDSGSSYGTAASVGRTDGCWRCRLTAGLQLHGQTNPKPAGTERLTPGGMHAHTAFWLRSITFRLWYQLIFPQQGHKSLMFLFFDWSSFASLNLPVSPWGLFSASMGLQSVTERIILFLFEIGNNLLRLQVQPYCETRAE